MQQARRAPDAHTTMLKPPADYCSKTLIARRIQMNPMYLMVSACLSSSLPSPQYVFASMRVAVLGVIVAAEPHSGRSFRDGSNMLKHKKHGTQGHTMRMQLQCGWGATGMGIANAGLSLPMQCKSQPASTKTPQN